MATRKSKKTSWNQLHGLAADLVGYASSTYEEARDSLQAAVETFEGLDESNVQGRRLALVAIANACHPLRAAAGALASTLGHAARAPSSVNASSNHD